MTSFVLFLATFLFFSESLLYFENSLILNIVSKSGEYEERFDVALETDVVKPRFTVNHFTVTLFRYS